jgi:bacitracin synthase 3
MTPRRYFWATKSNSSGARISAEVPGMKDTGLLLSAFILLLSRYDAGEDIAIAEANQNHPVVYCFPCIRDETVSAFLARVRRQFAEGPGQREFPRNILDGPIALVIAEEPELSFDTERYSPRFANQFAAHYALTRAFLEGDGDSPLRQLDILSAAERAHLLAFNATKKDYPKGKLLHGLVEEQAAQTPHSVAVVYGKSQLTYAELDRDANRLAKFLRDVLGVGTGDLVGLIVGRSEKMIVALLGILKAGAGYVPINPRHPWETVDYMLRNAGIRTVLVNSDTAASTAGFQGELCVLDVEFPGLPACSRAVAAGVGGGDIAYVIYTSGSTGRPKGVAVEHRAIVNTIQWRSEYYGMDERDVTLQMPSYAFDSSIVDIFSCLVSGGKLVIPDEDLRLDAQYLKSVIQSHGVTRSIVTPSYYTLLNRELEGAVGIRSITVAGENVTLDLVKDHHRYLPGVRLINEYGPTENAVCSTACELTATSTRVHIGTPIANTQVFVLDADLRPVPLEAPGEIYLAGAGLARGYVNQPALTEERFLPSSIAEFPGRMYKTGDWARWREDGTLEFLGRVDNQVKVRGFRIELNEIEQALLKHPGIDMAAVLCKEDGGGQKYLAAYVASPRSIPVVELSQWTQRSLPYYMTPDVIRVMRKLPLNLNGKVDSGALAKLPDFERATDAHSASGPTQLALAALCRAILQRGEVGANDNLFSLGANSLRVMELVSRIRTDLQANIELLDVYAYPTIAELAARIENRRARERSAQLHARVAQA